jgi:hypothetical protein
MADDDHVMLVNDDRLAEAELAERSGDRVDSLIVEPWVLLVGFDIRQRTKFDLHDDHLG